MSIYPLLNIYIDSSKSIALDVYKYTKTIYSTILYAIALYNFVGFLLAQQKLVTFSAINCSPNPMLATEVGVVLECKRPVYIHMYLGQSTEKMVPKSASIPKNTASTTTSKRIEDHSRHFNLHSTCDTSLNPTSSFPRETTSRQRILTCQIHGCQINPPPQLSAHSKRHFSSQGPNIWLNARTPMISTPYMQEKRRPVTAAAANNPITLTINCKGETAQKEKRKEKNDHLKRPDRN